MAKQIKTVLKLNLPAGTATPAPPVGPILGQAGINMMAFLKEYNDKTKDQKGQVIPAEITVFQDGPFNDFLGTVNGIDEGKGKVSVLVNIFGRETPVELDFLQIKKI